MGKALYQKETIDLRLWYMQAKELEYNLPQGLIAQQPLMDRAAARLLVLNRSDGNIEHRCFSDVLEYLRPGDCLVLNRTKVIPARFWLRRATGGRIEGLFLELTGGYSASNSGGGNDSTVVCWQVLLKNAGRLRKGERITMLNHSWQLCNELTFIAVKNAGGGQWVLQPEFADNYLTVLDRCGVVPLPPYIKRKPGGRAVDAVADGLVNGTIDALSDRIVGKDVDRPIDKEESAAGVTGIDKSAPEYCANKKAVLLRQQEIDREYYQTVYAQQEGSVAAPTAGLHFTSELLEAVRQRHIRLAYVTLHVGIGTFKPVTVEDMAEHKMHSEYYQLDDDNADIINDTLRNNGRVIAVGTTSVRTLETCGVWIGGDAGYADIANNTGKPDNANSNANTNSYTATIGSNGNDSNDNINAPVNTDDNCGMANGRMKAYVRAGEGYTDIFIKPGYEFKIVSCLITNFHLPRSTLLALVFALAGRDNIMRAYQQAIERRYRFFSYGDAMLIL